MIGNLSHNQPVPPTGQSAQGGASQSVGHQAKAAVTAAREAGADLSKNAQGLAASGLARGADPETLFASLIAPDLPVADDAVSGPVVDPADPASEPATLPAAPGETGDATATDATVESGAAPPSLDATGELPADGDRGAPAAIVPTVDPGDTTGGSAQDIALALLEDGAGQG